MPTIIIFNINIHTLNLTYIANLSMQYDVVFLFSEISDVSR